MLSPISDFRENVMDHRGSPDGLQEYVEQAPPIRVEAGVEISRECIKLDLEGRVDDMEFGNRVEEICHLSPNWLRYRESRTGYRWMG